ncbi:MAG: hypothetical protein ACXAE3_09055 [Candidatus Kariarchaeaceae archaeon]
MNTILLVAMEDDVISEDELAILRQVKLDIQSLREAIHDLEKKDETSEEESDRLKDFRKNLLQNVYDISKEDKIITQDERNMINSLIKSLMTE